VPEFGYLAAAAGAFARIRGLTESCLVHLRNGAFALEITAGGRVAEERIRSVVVEGHAALGPVGSGVAAADSYQDLGVPGAGGLNQRFLGSGQILGEAGAAGGMGHGAVERGIRAIAGGRSAEELLGVLGRLFEPVLARLEQDSEDPLGLAIVLERALLPDLHGELLVAPLQGLAGRVGCGPRRQGADGHEGAGDQGQESRSHVFHAIRTRPPRNRIALS
jgi:hypothetical protein